jgi:hypothetical protein
LLNIEQQSAVARRYRRRDVTTETDERSLLIRLRNLAPRLDELVQQTRQLCDDITAAARRARNSITPKLPVRRIPRRRHD